MSLGKTLLKVAIGVAIAKGVSTLAGSSGKARAETPTRTTTSRSTAGRGTRYDGGRGNLPGGLEDMMDDILGTSKPTARRDTGGDLLDQITGNKRRTPRKTAPKGGMDDLLGQLTGGRQSSGGDGGLGDLLGGFLGGASATTRRTPEQDREISAALMLRAMITAVKADGELDAEEKARLMEAMGDASAAEVKAVNAELARPVDIEALVRIVPAGLEAQVYLVSLSAIDLDQQAEAEYLHALAQGLELTAEEVNALHDRVGAPRLYR